MFNPDQFLDTTIDNSNDTSTIPVPVGEYTGIVDKVAARQWTKKDDPSVGGIALDILWIVDSTDVCQLLGREKVTCKQGIMLDLTESGGIDMGKGRNIGLGRLREALDLNTPGKPFSFNMLPGQVAKINITHRISGEDIFAEVKSVSKL